MAALRTHDVTDRLAEIAAPTLVVHGDHDVLIPVDVARLVAAAIPNAELEVLEDVAHAIDLEAPERLASLVRGFLAGDSEEA
jgi:pimeloyl-ACP methyl ester carboxylesterase